MTIIAIINRKAKLTWILVKIGALKLQTLKKLLHHPKNLFSSIIF